MKLLMVYGSPHKNGTTKALADAFLSGVDLRKYTVQEIRIADKNIGPCMACEFCKSHDGVCVRRDDMNALYPLLLDADLVVFVTPLYYFGFSAQMKTFIDRFYAVNGQLRVQTRKKAILLTAGGGKEEWIMDGILANYNTMLRYLHWESLGAVCALGCHVKMHLEDTDYPDAARKLGASL